MRTIGIIGGIGRESTVDYYKKEQQVIQHKLFSEIELGIFKDETKAELLSIVKRLVNEEGIDAIILGCTELPLVLTESQYGIPFINTTSIPCERIITYCIESE